MEEILQLFIGWAKVKVRLHLKESRFYFKERDVWWVSLGINVGSEENGKNEKFERPVLVLKKFNHDMFLSIPFTSQNQGHKYSFTLFYQKKETFLILSQIRLISSKRLIRKVRRIDKSEFFEIKTRLKNLL